MRILLTGATGYVGSRVAEQLARRGHAVTGVVRSESLGRLPAGVHPFVARLEEHARIGDAAPHFDVVINTGFPSHGTDWTQAVAVEAQLLHSLAASLAGTGSTLIVSNGTAFYGDGGGRQLDEATPIPNGPAKIRADATSIVRSLRGTRSVEIRLASFVYGAGGSVFVPMLLRVARSTGRSIYTGDGANRISTVHVDDAAAAYVAAVERDDAAGVFHVASDEAPSMRELAAAIGLAAGVPASAVSLDEARRLTDPFTAMFLGLDNALASRRARCALAWAPAPRPGLLWDVAFGSYAHIGA